MNYHVAIIGAGPVGLFAAFQAGLLGMKSCVIDALQEIGGQCSALYPEKPIYDIPGYPKILARDLVENLKNQADAFSPAYYSGRLVTSCDAVAGDCFKLSTSSDDTIYAKIILIAAGCGAFGPNRLPIDGISEYEGKSVFYSVPRISDFAGKKVVIAGGGDSAVDWAIALSEIASSVSLVHRRNKFRAAPNSVKQLHELSEAGKLSLVTGYQLDAVSGSDGILSSVIVKDLEGKSKVLDADALLAFFGLSQDLGPISHWGLNLNSNHINVSLPYYQTNVDGIYAVGDVAYYEGKLKLILTGFAEVASSLHHGYKRVFDGKELHFEHSTTRGVSCR